jgi:hypothetical protein
MYVSSGKAKLSISKQRRCTAQLAFASALRGDETLTARPDRRTASTHYVGGWVGLRAGLDVLVFETRTVVPVALLLYLLSYPGRTYRHLSECELNFAIPLNAN